MLRAILESAVAAILAIDGTGRIQSVNGAAERMFGYTAEEMLGESVNMLMPEPFRSRHDGYLAHYLKTGEKRIIGIGREVEARRKDGTIFPVQLAVSEFEMGGEKFFSGIITDLSTRARLQAEIDRQSLLFQTVFNHVPEALVISDPDGRVLLLNPAASRVFGYGGDEAIGLDVSILFDRAEDIAHLQEDFSADYSNRDQSTARLSVTLCRKNGTKFPGQGHATAISAPNGDPMAVVTLLRDVTDELRQKEALLKSQRLEAIGQLTGGIAHDFNNLLTIISGNLELLESSITNSADLDLLNRASRAADAGARLTNRLLTFARRRQLEPAIVNLNEQVRSMTELLRRTLGDTIELRTHLAPALWLTQVDASEAESAVLNLAINARDAMPAGGRLDIRTENISLEAGEVGFDGPLAAGDYVRISVSDNGTGMSKETLKRVFEPFFTTKAPGRGTGLGLSTIYGFIKQSNGNVTIYSEPGVGTTVNLYLPRCDGAAGIERSAARAAATEVSKGERVLVVEDSPDVRALSVKRLERLGYRVTACSTGAEAKAALEGGLDVDVVFTDIMMPGGTTGIDLGKWISDYRPQLPVVLTTGFAEETARGMVDSRETWPILRKPYTQKDLAAIMRSVLAKQVNG